MAWPSCGRPPFRTERPRTAKATCSSSPTPTFELLSTRNFIAGIQTIANEQVNIVDDAHVGHPFAQIQTDHTLPPVRDHRTSRLRRGSADTRSKRARRHLPPAPLGHPGGGGGRRLRPPAQNNAPWRPA